MIGCIGWGSLIWSPRELPLTGRWAPNGPRLPIEFAREAPDGRITLVITPGAAAVPTLWVKLATPDLATAREMLRRREGIGEDEADRHVGWWTPEVRSGGPSADVAASWARDAGLAGVVWTALPPGLRGSPGVVPPSEEVLAYLRTISADTRQIAEEYVRRAPAQVDTAYRRLIERELGWERERGDGSGA